jgi:hypothetical protein
MLFSVQSPPNMIIICLIRGKCRSRWIAVQLLMWNPLMVQCCLCVALLMYLCCKCLVCEIP